MREWKITNRCTRVQAQYISARSLSTILHEAASAAIQANKDQIAMVILNKDEACRDTGVMDNMHPDCKDFVSYNLCNDDVMYVAFMQNYPPHSCCHRELRVFV